MYVSLYIGIVDPQQTYAPSLLYVSLDLHFFLLQGVWNIPITRRHHSRISLENIVAVFVEHNLHG